MDVAADLDEALDLLLELGDVVELRPSGSEAPVWAAARGWDAFLGAISDEALREAQADPAGWLRTCADAPPSLRALAEAASRLVRRFEPSPALAPTPAAARERHVKARKHAQLGPLVEVARRRFPDASRVVDFGAGHGHLTRALLRELALPEALGVDWDAGRVARATELARAAARAGAVGPRFVHADASREERTLRRGDLVVGLHPCGALGDALVGRARDAGAHVLAVSCCFQKIGASAREASSARARRRGFVVPRHALGLANLSPESFEGSADVSAKQDGRRTRHALRALLEGRGLSLGPGDEARGVPKDRVRRGLAEIAELACRARGLTPPTPHELELAEARASVEHARVARFSLPRHALGRVLELAIVLDRACVLEEAGYEVEVAPLFPARVSPRNLGIVART
ncbi:MAG: methyltransferase [Myxococcales bacterium]|nr:methyltransferase [Myxococcales bacterium]